MAEKTLNTRQKQKYDTSVNWTTNNPTLLAGEIGIESDTNKFKVGNGTSTWNELDYAGGGEVVLYSTTGQNTDGAMTQKAVTDSLPQAVEIDASTGQPSVTSEQFTKLLESPDNYIIVTMSQQDDVGNLIEMNVKLTRADHTKLTVGTAEQDLLLFTGVYEGSSELSSVTSILLSRFSNTPDEIEVSFSSIDYATQSDIPTALSQLSEDANHRLVTDTEKSTWNAKSDFSGSYNDLTNKPNLFSGNYNDLTDKPTIPTSLSELTEDSAHRLVTDTEKTTWNTKSDFSGSYNDLTDKPTISTINVDSQPQSTINFDSDPQTQINNIVNNTTKIKNSSNGFAGGYNASAGLGGAIGNNSYTTYGGAIGWHSDSKHGGAVGNGARATDGGAIGSGATNTIGFSGGYEAKTGTTLDPIDAIQLGTGTNTIEKSLQIYDDNIYNADTHTLNVQNAIFNGGAGTSSVGIGNGTITADNNITSKTITATSNLNCDTDNVWFGGGQSENVVDNHAIKTTSSSQTVNNNSNNYVRYNSGLIIQWGHAPINTDNSVRITFSYPFIDANYSIVVLDGDNTDWNTYLNGYRLDGTKAGTDLPLGKSSTQCQIAKRGLVNDFDWIAIGRWK